MAYHVIPINDKKPHIEKRYCKCSPKLIYQDGVAIYVHNSYDGREVFEQAAAQIKDQACKN